MESTKNQYFEILFAVEAFNVIKRRSLVGGMNVFFERSLELFEGKEKMVVIAYYYLTSHVQLAYCF